MPTKKRARQQTKYIFVTGGVLSGLGKGITAASIGNLLVRQGLKVFMQKFDQYLNVDAGTLNPNEHGEVFVTDDGAEADLDLGHYERFIDVNLTKASSVMSGQIYAQLLEKERRGDYLGKTVQFIAHLVPLVCEHIEAAAQEQQTEVLITEIGGTVGDYEGLLFIEAARQMTLRAGRENVMYVHVGFLPYLEVTQEVKSKPLQNSIDDLRGFGIQPDLVMARCDHHVPVSALKKIALFGGLAEESVVPLETVDSVYEVPLILEKYRVDQLVMKRLGLPKKQPADRSWSKLVDQIKAVQRKGARAAVTVALVGKYMEMKDTYISVTEALKAAGWREGVGVKEVWIEAEHLEKAGIRGLAPFFKGVDAVVVPGGFGTRGVEGIILAADYCRRHRIPYLGLCYGMQLAVIAHARALGLSGAHTTEVDGQTPYPVIDILPDQDLKKLGGTMRLGAYPAHLEKDTQIAALYQELRPDEVKLAGARVAISERHRHRYEVNPLYHERLNQRGLRFAGLSPDGTLVEFIEYDKQTHPYFVGTQAHPELRSRPNRPHPLFVGLIRAAK